MVGLERTVLPLLGEQEFGLTSKTAITSFIVSFGVTKAILNLVAARVSDRIGRKPILVTGWLFALPVPFLIIYAPAWWWIDLANVLLGANQALAWSMTVIMKIDLVGPKRRGLALGLNEFAGYFAVGVMSWVTGYIAAQHGAAPAAVLPRDRHRRSSVSLVSIFFVRETRGPRASRSRDACRRPPPRPGASLGHDLLRDEPRQRQPLRRLSGGPRQQPQRRDVVGTLSAVLRRATASGVEQHRPHQGGLSRWCGVLLQVATGPLSDRVGRKALIAWRHDRAGGGHLADGPRPDVCRLARRCRPSGLGHRHGVPDASRRDHGLTRIRRGGRPASASIASGVTSATRSAPSSPVSSRTSSASGPRSTSSRSLRSSPVLSSCAP